LTDKEIIANLLEEFRISKLASAKIISDLRKEVKDLKEKLSNYENPKDSKNSSIVPSQDPNRQTKSLRKQSDKKVGGQKGHKGSKLNKVSTPNKIVFHDISVCECCQSVLPQAGEVKSRQIFDIPEIKIKVTEHRIIHKKCTNCGAQNKSVFPKELVQEAQYGNNIKAFGVYLQNYQMIPYGRCVELIYDLTGHKLSAGSLANFQAKMHIHLTDFEKHVKQHLLQSSVLHVDETGIRLNGKLNWMHVASTDLISFFGYHPKRGKEAINDFNIIPLYNGNLVHDRFSPYFSYDCEHSLCNAHILRELLFLWESKQLKWAKDLSNLLVNVHHKEKQGIEFTQKQYQKILRRLEVLIAPTIQNYNKVYSKTKEEKLAFALEKHKYLFLKFIKEKEVPLDNNQAERDLLMIKVKQKVSGCFREEAYAQYFARIRSYIATLKKNQQEILINILNAFENNCFSPNLAE
jgi:transposase